ncbi:hypothetical protein ACOMHN_057577 [Nucella lapillus]
MCCLHFHKLCDCVKDCEDGSDEDPRYCPSLYDCPISSADSFFPAFLSTLIMVMLTAILPSLVTCRDVGL